MYLTNIRHQIYIGTMLLKLVPGLIQKIIYNPENISVIVNSKNLNNILSILKLNTIMQCKMLLDIVCVDCLNIEENKLGRFKLIYVLNSVFNNNRIHVIVYLKNNETIESCSSLFSSAVWLEREIWDMYGVYFANHPDLRRILTDYGFSWYPLKKDFPLTGYIEVYYDINDKKIIYKPIELMQEFRMYEYGISWGDHEKKTFLENIVN
uniref:NADH dehydrogenase subunit 9 n=1 Tax=Heterostelium pallidum TaxID=13642 RepID=Q5ILL9_HETPA|nr:NADH dehydrogenase subunit 9 [Heterostelium pallidum]AAU00591.1 NADH dehydrogenase subunit 9 [Heterostelium pallidum]